LRAVPQILRHLATLHILAKHRKDPELARCCVRNCHFCGFINLEDLEGLNITYYIYILLYSLSCFPARLGAQPGSAHKVLNEVQNSSPLRSTWFGFSTLDPRPKLKGKDVRLQRELDDFMVWQPRWGVHGSVTFGGCPFQTLAPKNGVV